MDADGRVALVGARVVPVTAPPLEHGTVLLHGDRIEAVGDADLPVPDDATRVDVTGRWVLPGLIDAHTHLGIQEDGLGAVGDDRDEPTEPVGARFRALDAINPEDPGFRDAISGGVLAAGVSTGASNAIGGQAAAVRCFGRTVEDMVLREPCGIGSALGEEPRRSDGLPGTRMGTAAVIRTALTRARRRLDGDSGDSDDVAGSLDSAALARVLVREIPWRQHAHRSDDIATAIRLADEFGYRLVIVRGTEADRVAGLLAEHRVPVVLGPVIVSRRSVEMARRSLRTAGRLARAGVTIALTTEHYTNPIQYLAHQATFAVREGLDPEVALRALTVNPAEILGIDDRVGSLEPGKDADLCIWSGDPLDVAARVEAAYVRGRQVYRYDQRRGAGLFGEQEWAL